RRVRQRVRAVALQAARRVRRVLPLHGGDRLAAGSSGASVREARAADGAGVRRHVLRRAGRDLGIRREAALGELREAGPLLIARADRLLALVARLVGGVLGDGEHLADDLVVARRVLEQLLDPAFGLEVAVDEPASEQDSDADVRERAEREQPIRSVDQLAALRM